MSVRRYGYFECDDCGRRWGSSQVYCDEYDEAMYAQDCKHCGTASFPYHVEPIRCSQCLETDCVCTEDDLEEKKRHVDPNKPHMKELCHKCRAGIPCASNHEGERRYGHFRCTKCGKKWESSHVYCRQGTDKVMFKQECKDCRVACFPYQLERIRCSMCQETDCVCTEEELEEKRLNIDPNKPHLSHLCLKCRAGKPCTGYRR
ncbi:hypothetical protein BaRGS_00008062 [Batillaria attramentaria]|uniref:3CxxC-type domain-containing protein n=1 Tax=Batillaria attramentaria TaxID=370345 RepID=A0ABD0LNM9_9CAEN